MTMDSYKAQLLSELELDNLTNLSFEELKTTFLMTIRDFKNGKLKLEELSWFASELVQMPLTNDNKEIEELKEIIHLCSEIVYYLRQIPEVDKDGKNTIWFLLETMNYYEKNKKTLSNEA
ncbi:MAG: hypothetical protein ABI425_04085 [Patescibacteria group bacterium]